MPNIINEGFTEKTLAELKKLCSDNFDEDALSTAHSLLWHRRFGPDVFRKIIHV
jgi:hypothetical protein